MPILITGNPILIQESRVLFETPRYEQAYLVIEYSKFQQPMMEDFIDGINKDRKVFENNRTLIEKLVIEEVKEGTLENRCDIIKFAKLKVRKYFYG